MNSQDLRFTSLGTPRVIWAISAIHGELEKVYAIHDAILERLRPGDRILYFGNVTGHGSKSRETVDEIITFRRLALSQPGMKPSDIAYLRGRHEDMWNKLYQLPFVRDPGAELATMLAEGLEATLHSYEVSARDGIRSCLEGVTALTRWTMQIREAVRRNPGHDLLLTQHRRAAFTADNARKRLLFVNTGVDPARPFEEQDDSFWKDGDDFHAITRPYASFDKVIRGYDPRHAGVRINCVTASLDGGAGFGGSLVCAGIDGSGDIRELLQA